MKKQYSSVDDFISDLKKESLKQTILDMGYIVEDDFKGSMIRCVFHQGDRTPSLQVTDNFFKCYGCDNKGDLIKWVQLYDSLTFMEAIEKIANFMNVEILGNKISQTGEMRNKIKLEWNSYQKAFQENVQNNKTLLEMSRRFFPLECGYDIRENRIVLPLTSKIGTIMGFTKRRLNEEDQAKWKHSSMQGSLIGQVHNIFNLHNANKEIDEQGFSYFVEGPGDVASMIRAGFKNTIAVCGTSNFSDKVMEILEPNNNFVFVMDGDKAGDKANKNNVLTIAKYKPLNLERSFIVSIPDGKDPGDMNSEELQEAISNKENSLVWFVNTQSNEDILKLYNECSSEIIKPKILYLFANRFNYTIKQAQEILFIKNKPNSSEDKQSYYQRLLATIGKCEDINIEPLPISEEKAKIILKLRYKEEY